MFVDFDVKFSHARAGSVGLRWGGVQRDGKVTQIPEARYPGSKEPDAVATGLACWRLSNTTAGIL